MTSRENHISRLKKLITMLTYKRPGGSDTEREFTRRFLNSAGAKSDAYGNFWRVMSGNDDILFSSHTDTVHKTPGRQVVEVDAHMAWTPDGECLGADCGVGVWLMLEMITAKIPGTYIFHAHEESGGHGSAAIAKDAAARIARHKFAIAFDRAGTDEIITHQWAGRTASDAFAESLATILHPMKYKKSDRGSFTDTANYAHAIPECTNIGVGYVKQHQQGERLDLAHALRLREALLTADWSRLVCARDPTLPEPPDPLGAAAYGGWGRYTPANDASGETEEDLENYVRREYAATAALLEHLGITKDDIEEYVYRGW